MKNYRDDHPCFHISVVAQMLGLHPQTIRNYEKMGLVRPSRTNGNVRLFSNEDMDRVRKIHSYTEAGVNLAGVEIIMKLLDQINSLQGEMDNLMNRVTQEKDKKNEEQSQQSKDGGV